MCIVVIAGYTQNAQRAWERILPTIIENVHLATILRDEPREICANNRRDCEIDKTPKINFICAFKSIVMDAVLMLAQSNRALRYN